MQDLEEIRDKNIGLHPRHQKGDRRVERNLSSAGIERSPRQQAARIRLLSQTMRFDLLPLGVRETEAIHGKLPKETPSPIIALKTTPLPTAFSTSFSPLSLGLRNTRMRGSR